jgi:drug/metabolite transporter (DMT)-like permease
MENETSQGRIRAALITIQVLFGINYLASKFIVSALTPGAWAALRTSGAFVFLFCVVVFGKRRLPKRRDIGLLAVGALFGVVLNQGLFLEGLARTTVSRSSLICSQIPTFVLLFSVLSRQEKLSPVKTISFLAGLSGVMVLLEADQFQLDSQYLPGDLMTVANAASFALFVVLSRRVMARNDPWAATAVVFFFGSLGMLAYGGQDLVTTPLSVLTPGLIGAMVFVILGATVLTYYLNLWAVKRVQATRVAMYIFLQPVIASVLGIVFRNEIITPRFLVATGLVFLALVLRDGRPRPAG